MKTKKVFINASWIIGCKIVQSILGAFITMLTARYFGPSNYGLINYAASLVAFVMPISTLALDSILVNEFITHTNQDGEILGTSIAMSLVSSLFCILGLIGFVSLANPGETTTLIVSALYSLLLLARAAEMTQCWFQAHLLSKYISIATLIAYLAKSVYQIYLMVRGSSVYWFAITNALDVFLIDIIILYFFRKETNQNLCFSWSTAKRMLSQSRYYIISSMMATIITNTDRIMIKMMLGDAQTGFYSAAVTCAGMTGFVFSAILSSMRPAILEQHINDEKTFENTMALLYAILLYLSVIQAVLISVFAPIIVRILYGSAFAATVEPLRYVVWYTPFSYLGAARNIWVLANSKQHVLWKISLIGALGNVILNGLLIPKWGVSGAAIASLVTQIITNFVLCFIIKELRPTLRYWRMSCNPKAIIQMIPMMIDR